MKHLISLFVVTLLSACSQLDSDMIGKAKMCNDAGYAARFNKEGDEYVSVDCDFDKKFVK